MVVATGEAVPGSRLGKWLTVEVKNAKDLPKMDMIGHADAVCKVAARASNMIELRVFVIELLFIWNCEVV